MKCGGTTDARSPSADEKTMFAGLKGAVEGKAGSTFENFEPVSLKSQVVAGTNFFVKYNVGPSCVHVRVHQPLPGQGDLQVVEVQTGKASGDSIDFF